MERERLVAVAAHQAFNLRVRDPRKDCRIGDLVAVQMEDRKHRPIGGWIQELVGVPTRGERAGLGLAVAHDAGNEKIGIVEGRAVGVDEGVAEFAALVDGAGSLWSHMAWDSIRPTELAEEALDAVGVLLDMRIHLGVGTFEIGVGHDAGTAMAGADDVKHFEAAFANQAIPVDIEKVKPGRGAPVAQKARLHVVERERAPQQRIIFQVDLAHRKVVGGPPVGIHAGEHVCAERALGCGRAIQLFRHIPPLIPGFPWYLKRSSRL